MRRRTSAVPSGVLGYYDPASNRITMYDMGGDGNSANWQRNAAVLIHEATHQMAFNTGIHSRYAPTPTWVAEGLATLFEAPGVCDSHNHTQMADRVNRLRLRAFRQVVAPRHRPELLASIVACDELFHADVQTAYAEAWAFELLSGRDAAAAVRAVSEANRRRGRRFGSTRRRSGRPISPPFSAAIGGCWRPDSCDSWPA